MENRNVQVEAWYRANANKIKKWASKRSKQDAEDILQDTAVKLLRSPAKWEAITQKKVTKWAMFEYYKDYQEMDEIEDGPVEFNMEAQIYAKKSVELIEQLVNSVNGAGRQIFVMHFFQDMGYEEIALKLGMDHLSVKQLGSRAKGIIVEKFKEIINK